jgi:hypothetical protein
MSGAGFRTLVVASKAISNDDYAKWAVEYKEACASLEGRDAKVCERAHTHVRVCVSVRECACLRTRALTRLRSSMLGFASRSHLANPSAVPRQSCKWPQVGVACL